MAEHDDETPTETDTPVLRMVAAAGLVCSGDVCEMPAPSSVDVE